MNKPIRLFLSLSTAFLTGALLCALLNPNPIAINCSFFYYLHYLYL